MGNLKKPIGPIKIDFLPWTHSKILIQECVLLILHWHRFLKFESDVLQNNPKFTTCSTQSCSTQSCSTKCKKHYLTIQYGSFIIFFYYYWSSTGEHNMKILSWRPKLQTTQQVCNYTIRFTYNSVYTAHCTVQTIQCTRYSANNTVYTVQCKQFSVRTRYSANNSVYTVQCTVQRIQCTLYSVQSKEFSVHCSVKYLVYTAV